MQTTLRKTETKVKSKEKTSKDDATPLSKKPQEEKLKRSVYSVSTPRNYVQKSSTADIYAQKKKTAVQVTKAPKKVPGVTNKSSNVSPMKDQLKSSSSSVSQISLASAKKVKSSPQIKVQAKVPSSARSTKKDLPFLNVTVNSPVAKRRLEIQDGERNLTLESARRSKDSKNKSSNFEDERKDPKSSNAKEVKRRSTDTNAKEGSERQRTKTRTLNDNEVKVLTPDAVDNNAEMLNLSRKLSAKPKAFYVDLDESIKEKPLKAEKSSEEEIDYEDDFESYESDFESPSHSDSHTSDQDVDDQNSDDQNSDEHEARGVDGDQSGVNDGDEVVKEGRDEEKMLDSGNFDLRDARSANKAKPALMADILEDTELDVRSLTDEGFQDMSGCSIRTVHADVLERPLFIDFTKAKETKRKRKIFERLKQRAKDILSMVTLHEMSYSLFEMKPIPYDLYMATFGRSNYIQTASQTFDDGISEEVQTEEILCEEKWTQHPVEFSKNDIYLKGNNYNRKYSLNTEDYLSKFTFLIGKDSDVEINNRINIDEDYKSNPLRIFFEQKDGAGPAEMLPYENYKKKLKNNDFNSGRLKKFLKKYESAISNILCSNVGSSSTTDLIRTKYPFSQGYTTISTKNISSEKLKFLKQMKVSYIIFSESKSSIILTVHKKCGDVLDGKCVICLWDMSIVRNDPIKILIAIDDVNIGRYKGNTDGIFAAALNDGSLHLWDLTEEPTWLPDVDVEAKTTNLVEVEAKALTQTELDREWNLKNSHVGFEPITHQCILQACSFTSSAGHVQTGDPPDAVVGLELDLKGQHSQEGGRRLLGQVCSLQRIGILTIWSIIQEKKATDMGKAYWSKMQLEMNQKISLIEYMDLPRSSSTENVFVPPFNLNAAKRRTSVRRKEKSLKKQLSRQKSAVKSDSDRPASVASVKIENLPQCNWESGMICSDLKIMRLDSTENYLIGKNCGEVLRCTRSAGVFKVNRFCVATDSSSVTSIDVSTHSLPYFLAATDSGTVNLCSVLEARVLLTLDCRNGPPTAETEKYNVDHKGRYLGSTNVRPQSASPSLRPSNGIAVKSIIWSHVNPCCMFALLGDGSLQTWELTHSDIHARHVAERAASVVASVGDLLALLTPEGEVQLHRAGAERRAQECLQLFRKYIALL